MTLEDFKKKEPGIYVRERRRGISVTCSLWSARILAAIGAVTMVAVGSLFAVGIQRADEVLKDAAAIKQWQKQQIEWNAEQRGRVATLEDWRHEVVDPKLWEQGCEASRCKNLENEIDNLKDRLR